MARRGRQGALAPPAVNGGPCTQRQPLHPGPATPEPPAATTPGPQAPAWLPLPRRPRPPGPRPTPIRPRALPTGRPSCRQAPGSTVGARRIFTKGSTRHREGDTTQGPRALPSTHPTPAPSPPPPPALPTTTPWVGKGTVPGFMAPLGRPPRLGNASRQLKRPQPPLPPRSGAQLRWESPGAMAGPPSGQPPPPQPLAAPLELPLRGQGLGQQGWTWARWTAGAVSAPVPVAWGTPVSASAPAAAGCWWSGRSPWAPVPPVPRAPALGHLR